MTSTSRIGVQSGRDGKFPDEPETLWQPMAPREARQALEFALPEGADRLRIVFDVDEGFFHLYRLVVFEAAPKNGEVVWQTRDMAALTRQATLRHLLYGRSIIGEVFVAARRGAWLEFALPCPGPCAGRRLRVELDWPKSKDYVIARQAFLAQQHELTESARRREQEIRRLELAAAELKLIEQSRVWRTAEFLRELLYVKLLGRLPRLQRRALAVSRGGREGAVVVDHAALDKARQRTEKPGTRRINPPEQYEIWKAGHQFNAAALRDRQEQIRRFERRPKISIIMPVFNMAPRWLERAIESVHAQLYDNWELCIVDDASTDGATCEFLQQLNHPKITVQRLAENLNIAGASNKALAMAGGEYVALLDHDDELAVDALFEVVAAINAYDPDFIYTDEDFINLEGEYVNPHFKPDFSPDLLLSHNYITHLAVLRRALVQQLDGFAEGVDGAQDYDLFLRATEIAGRIHHIPKVLYHWRMGEWSTSFDAEAKPAALASARTALERALGRRQVAAGVRHANIPHYFRIAYEITGRPTVSIVIPFKDKPELLRMCLDGVLQRTNYREFEVIGVSNNSESPETFQTMEEYERRDSRIRFVEHNVPFNFSALVNHGVAQATGDHIVLLNNDIEMISWDWLEALLEHSQREEVGCVGGKLYYPNSTIQHAGIIVGIKKYAGHGHRHFQSNSPGYFNRLNIVYNTSAVTGACMMVKRALVERVGGFDEAEFSVACNDVDFCLRVRALGFWNVFTPYMEAWHRESSSRGYEDTPAKKQRFAKEKARFGERHGEILKDGDPFYNVNLTLETEQYDLRVCDEQFRAWSEDAA